MDRTKSTDARTADKSAYGGGTPHGLSKSRGKFSPRKPKQCFAKRSNGKWVSRTRPAKRQSNRVPLPDGQIISCITSHLVACLRDVRDTFPGYGCADFDRDSKTVTRRVAAEGAQFATGRLPVFFDGLLAYLETGKSDYPGFKMKPGQHHPVFLQGLVAPIYADPCSDSAVKCVKHLYQFCVAFKKLEGKADKLVLSDQLADFVQTDIDLTNLDWSVEPVRDIARMARKTIGRITRGLNPFDINQAENFRPRPGPGSTNTSTKHAHRFRPRVWYNELMTVFNPEEWFRPPFAPPTQGRRWQILKHSGVTAVGRRKRKPLTYVEAGHAPLSRFKFVPKTSLKWRGICIEENELQWHQQALRRGLYKHLESHPETKGMVNFTDQLVNRQLALAGSVDKRWATIDMSSASDRISRKLVAYLFGENKELLRALETCSTQEVELPEDAASWFLPVMPLKKIAPMGSAICFPIMALVHYSLIRAILDSSSLPRALTRKVYVYGDDIICRRECAQAIYDYLPFFGMKINVDKSFSQSYFRESCGLHAYKGVDVTPIRFKSVLHTSSSPQVLATALRLEQAFFKKGYLHSAALIREKVLEVAKRYGIKHVPYVHTESSLFGFYREGGDATLMEFSKHHKRRWIPGFDRASQNCVKLSDKTVRLNKSLKEIFIALLTKWRPDLPKYSHTWEYQDVVVIVDSFDEDSSFLGEEDRYLRYLTQDGIWASKKYDEGYSRNTKFVRKKLPTSALGYRS